MVAGAKGLYDIATSGLRITEAQERYDHRRAQYMAAEDSYKTEHAFVELKLNAWGETCLEAMVTLGKAVEFLRRAKVKEREIFENVQLNPQQLDDWAGISAHALGILSGAASSAVAGVATASATYGLVGTLGTASTGTAISTLSGAAATNATLAWLGGGALAAGGGGMALGAIVLNSVVAGPAVLVGGFFVGRQAEEIETEVTRNIAAMDVAEAEMELHVAEFGLITQRVDELITSTTQIDQALETLVSTSDPQQIEDIHNVYKTAKSLAELLDIAVVDKSRRLDSQGE